MAQASAHILNDDVLRYIFEEACKPEFVDRLREKKWRIDTSPFTLLAVSRTWRDVASRLHGIWRYANLGGSLRLLKEQLRYSGTLPIHVIYSDERYSFRKPEPQHGNTTADEHHIPWPPHRQFSCEDCLRLLLSPEYRSRLASFSIWTSSRDLFRYFRDEFANGALRQPPPSRLRSLELCFSGEDVTDPYSRPQGETTLSFRGETTVTFRGYLLHTLAITDSSLTRCLHSSVMYALRDLFIGCTHVPIQDIAALSRTAPTLRSLVLYSVRLYSKTHSDDTTAVFPCLTALALPLTRTLSLLGYVDTPALATLTLHTAPSPHSPPLRIAGCTALRTLRFNAFRAGLDAKKTVLAVRGVLRAAPSVTTLEVAAPDDTLRTLFAAAAPDGDADAPVLPCLDTVVICGAVQPASAEDHHTALIAFVQVRAAGGVPLRDVRLWRPTREMWGPERVAALARLVSVSFL